MALGVNNVPFRSYLRRWVFSALGNAISSDFLFRYKTGFLKKKSWKE